MVTCAPDDTALANCPFPAGGPCPCPCPCAVPGDELRSGIFSGAHGSIAGCFPPGRLGQSFPSPRDVPGAAAAARQSPCSQDLHLPALGTALQAAAARVCPAWAAQVCPAGARLHENRPRERATDGAKGSGGRAAPGARSRAAAALGKAFPGHLARPLQEPRAARLCPEHMTRCVQGPARAGGCEVAAGAWAAAVVDSARLGGSSGAFAGGERCAEVAGKAGVRRPWFVQPRESHACRCQVEAPHARHPENGGWQGAGAIGDGHPFSHGVMPMQWISSGGSARRGARDRGEPGVQTDRLGEPAAAQIYKPGRRV